jgi:hypothetical protein
VRRMSIRTPLSGQLVAALLVAAAGSALLYALTSIVTAYELSYAVPTPVRSTPASIGLDYRAVTFHSRTDHLQLADGSSRRRPTAGDRSPE